MTGMVWRVALLEPWRFEERFEERGSPRTAGDRDVWTKGTAKRRSGWLKRRRGCVAATGQWWANRDLPRGGTRRRHEAAMRMDRGGGARRREAAVRMGVREVREGEREV